MTQIITRRTKRTRQPRSTIPRVTTIRIPIQRIVTRCNEAQAYPSKRLKARLLLEGLAGVATTDGCRQTSRPARWSCEAEAEALFIVSRIARCLLSSVALGVGWLANGPERGGDGRSLDPKSTRTTHPDSATRSPIPRSVSSSSSTRSRPLRWRGGEPRQETHTHGVRRRRGVAQDETGRARGTLRRRAQRRVGVCGSHRRASSELPLAPWHPQAGGHRVDDRGVGDDIQPD